MIQFAADMHLPIQDNFLPQKLGKSEIGSIATTLRYGAAQTKARDEGKLNWRELGDDSSKVSPNGLLVHITLSLSTEIKKKTTPRRCQVALSSR